jgi:hypothetical protein
LYLLNNAGAMSNGASKRPPHSPERKTNPQVTSCARKNQRKGLDFTATISQNRKTSVNSIQGQRAEESVSLPTQGRISIFEKLRAKAKSSKFQTPSSKEAPSPKLKKRPARRWPRHLFLGFGA